VQRQKQIVVLTQLVNIITIIVAVLSGLGLGAMVLGLVISVPLGRLLSRKCFYDAHIKNALTSACEQNRLEIIKTLSVNSVKLGFTLVGGFLVVRASVLIGSVYLPLADIAAFGLTRQLTDVVISVSSVWFQAFYPKITQYRTQENYAQVKRLYIQSWWFFVLIFIAGAAVILGFGNIVLVWIGSKTLLIPLSMGALMLLMAFLENNHVMAANLLLMENRVPFYKASLIAGGITVVLMLVFFRTTEMGIWAMLLAPFIAQAMYQNWKWPSMIIRQYVIKPKDLRNAFEDALISLSSGIKNKFSGHVG
jgi:O-antigen/teichoic acid export membrane protein